MPKELLKHGYDLTSFIAAGGRSGFVKYLDLKRREI